MFPHLKRLPSGSAMMEEFILHGMAHGALQNLALHPLHFLPSPLPAQALGSKH